MPKYFLSFISLLTLSIFSLSQQSQPVIAQNTCQITNGGPWNHAFPRIIATDGDYITSDSNQGNLNNIARYHAVMWTLNWPFYHLYSNPPEVREPFSYVRNLNSQTKFIAVAHTYQVDFSNCHTPAYQPQCALYNAVDTASRATAPGLSDGWYIRNAEGIPIKHPTLNHWWINWSSYDPSNINNNFALWFSDFINSNLVDNAICQGKECWDGYYIEVFTVPHGSGGRVMADLNENGTPDTTEIGKCEMDKRQMDGYRTFAQRVQSFTGKPVGGENFGPGISGRDSPNYLLNYVTLNADGDFPGGTWPDCTNNPNGFNSGYTSLGDHWGLHMKSLISFENTDIVNIAMLGEDITGHSYFGPYVDNEEQHRRFTVGSALLTNAYSIPHVNQIPRLWPCDECLVSLANGRTTNSISDLGWLGCPLEDAKTVSDGQTLRMKINQGARLSDFVWKREYSNGIAIVNPTTQTQNILISGFKKINSSNRPGGNPNHNDGQSVTGNLSVNPIDSYVLIRTDSQLPATPTPNTGQNCPLPCPAGYPAKSRGNADCDDKIDLMDFAIWLDEFQILASHNPIPPTQRIANFDCEESRTGTHEVDLNDLAVWKSVFEPSL